MEISINDEIEGKQKRREIIKQFLVYAISKFGMNKSKVAKFMGYDANFVKKIMIEHDLLVVKKKKIDKVMSDRVKKWISENVKMYCYMDSVQKVRIFNVVVEHYEDLFYGKKNLRDLIMYDSNPRDL
jgi:hypothetical protein